MTVSTENSTGLFRVMRASAGSGKTYSLVKEYLKLALKFGSADYYKHILAITFTNAAAAEMKERVLQRLKELSESADSSIALKIDLVQELEISPDEVVSRSAAIFRSVLHNYSQLSIQTIDAFTHRLIRTFARELRLNQDFEVEMDTDRFVELLADKCLDNIGQEKQLTSYLQSIAIENLENEKGWNLRKDLIKIAKKLLSEDTATALEKLEQLKLDDFKKIRSSMIAKQNIFEKSIQYEIEAIQRILAESGLEVSDFAYENKSGISGILKSDSYSVYPKRRFLNMIEGKDWYPQKAAPELKARIDAIKEELLIRMNTILDIYNSPAYSEYLMQSKILEKLHLVGLLNSLNETAKQLKEEKNILLISDFHQLVNEVIKDSPAPFIYERIGNRYKHILIDEFQDTSSMQWSNAVPLIQNSLSENNMNLLVGDAKQAIYRWRGGRVEQFVNLPEVKINTEFVENYSFFKSHFKENILEYNYRSSRAVIDFNNMFYEHLAPLLGENNSVYASLHQEKVRDKEGYVKIAIIEQAKKSDESEEHVEILETILECIEDALKDGYRPCDIAILTRRGEKDSGQIASFLLGKYKVTTKESFLLTQSPSVRAIMAYLSYQSNPQKHASAIDLVQALQEINSQISLENFVSNNVHREGRELTIRLEDYLIQYYPNESEPASSVYSMTMNVIRRFHLKMDGYVECLLDHVRDKTIVQNKPLPLFIHWWIEKKEELYIASTPDKDAISIMTIHKSKGLQFPVVIYPRFSTKDMGSSIWISTDEKEVGLPVALVSTNYEETKENNIQLSDEIYKEVEKHKLDDLNICYVATTRAEDRLYLLLEKAQNTPWLTKEICTVLDTSFKGYKVGEHWAIGKEEKATLKNSEEIVETVHSLPSERNKLRLRAVNVYDNFSEELQRGNLIHQILAEVKDVDSIPHAISTIATQKSLTEDEQNTLQREISEIVNHTELKKWFEKDNAVIAEKELMTKDGQVLRPDRIVIHPEVVSVIDYKTGDPLAMHKRQVQVYIQHLKELYHKPIKGYIFYTQEKRVLEITEE